MVELEATYANIVQRMRFPCWITKTTDTLSICNTYRFSTATVVSRTRLSVLSHVRCLFCYLDTFYEEALLLLYCQ